MHHLDHRVGGLAEEEGSGAEDGEVAGRVVMIRHHRIRDIQAVSQVWDSKGGSQVSGQVLWVVLRRGIWLGIEDRDKKRGEDCLVVGMEVDMVVVGDMEVVHLEAREDLVGVEVEAVQGPDTKALALDPRLEDKLDKPEKIENAKSHSPSLPRNGM